MRMLIMLTAVCYACAALAQDFQLQTASGATNGPFQFREGETIQVGTNTATLVNIHSQENRILDAMQAIRIPEVDFRNANLYDVIEFLRPRSVSAHRPLINFVIKDNSNQYQQEQPISDDPFASSGDASKSSPAQTASSQSTRIPTITASAQDVSLKEILDYIVDVAGYKYIVRDDVVLIMPRDAPEGEIEFRMYNVLPSPITRLRDLRAAAGQNGRSAHQGEEDDLKAFFADMGVSWPTGSSIKHIRGLGKLVVANTRKNLEVFESCLATLNVTPYQIEIEVDILACDQQRVSHLGPDGMTEAMLTNLWATQEAELLASPRVMTQSGQAASLKGVSECIYPTSLVVSSGGCGTNTNSVATAAVIQPSDFQTREVGPIIEVMPEVSPDGQMLNISYSVEFVEPPNWKEYDGHVLNGDGTIYQTKLPQPQFHTHRAVSNVLLYAGKRILIVGGIPSRDGKRLIYMLLRARLVDPAGNPLPLASPYGTPMPGHGSAL